VLEGGVRLEEDEPLAPGMARFSVNVQLEILVVDEETPSLLEDGEV